MSIVIYTYKNPYEITTEDFWEEISNCPHFCSSQTMVNGLKSVDKKRFQDFRLTTIKKLVANLYKEWETPETVIKQYTEIDNLINRDLMSYPDDEKENLVKAFKFNSNDVYKSIRILFELNINAEQINYGLISKEQQYIVDIYKKIKENPLILRHFSLEPSLTEEEINEGIQNSLSDEDEVINSMVEELDDDKIVIHGIHQFSPMILRAIEQISKVKKVILLFNYQSQYKNVYQTWIDVYQNFESSILISKNKEYYPNNKEEICYSSNILADNIGSLLEGKRRAMSKLENIQLLEFDNMTEFTNYVSDKFEKGRIHNPDNPLAGMTEQFYSADGSVNDVLKIYYPKQFEERKFLNFPFGHFFIAIANMWNSESSSVEITNLNDVRECLTAGIIKEKEKGELISIFDKMQVAFERCSSISEMLTRIKKIKRNISRLDDEDNIRSLSHYSLSEKEISVLENGLNELDKIANEFFNDFDRHPNNFKEFYQKIKTYLVDEVMSYERINSEFRSIVIRVLERLNNVQNINVSGTLECLKSTMSVYLQQDEEEKMSANWIVRNFEQIDGDILRSNNTKGKIYHFSCLSDEDINCTKMKSFPWPLDSDFFNKAQNPIDWKYQVYVASAQEYKNFRRYALVYGLEFNRNQVRLSFIRHGKDNDKEPYYLFKMMGIEPVKYYKTIGEAESPVDVAIDFKKKETEYDRYDFYRWKYCKYKFLLESLLGPGTVYKDEFLQLRYFEIVLQKRALMELVGDVVSNNNVLSTVEEQYRYLKKYFPYVTEANSADLINRVSKKILSTRRKVFAQPSSLECEEERIKEIFMHDKLKDENGERIFITADQEANKQLTEELEQNNISYDARLCSGCKYCANKDICMKYYLG